MRIFAAVFLLLAVYYLTVSILRFIPGAFFAFTLLMNAAILLNVTTVPQQLHWFVLKKYGYGWTPNTWQGWAVIAWYLAIIVLTAYLADKSAHSGSDMLLTFVPFLAIDVATLLVVCYKTGEPPKWQWGNKL